MNKNYESKNKEIKKGENDVRNWDVRHNFDTVYHQATCLFNYWIQEGHDNKKKKGNTC